MPRPAKGARLYLRRRKDRETQWVIRDGVREFGTGCSKGDLKAAEERFSEYLSTRISADTGKRSLHQIKIEEVLALYGADVAPRRASAELIGYHMDSLLDFWGGKTLAHVKGSNCRAYVAHREALGRKAATAKRELKTLSAAINHWHGESALPAVPRVVMPIVVSKRERVLSRDEAAALLWAAHRLGAKHVARFVLIGLYTGTRHAAILSLGWLPALRGGHIDADRDVIYRKGEAERETSKRRPPCRIPSRLHGHVRRWRHADHGATNAVIHYNGQPILKMKRAWASVVREAGLGKDVTPHVLRHTCASWLLWQGKTIWDVAGMIGADASTVDRVYGHHKQVDGTYLGQPGGKGVGAAGFEPATPTPPEKRRSQLPRRMNANR